MRGSGGRRAHATVCYGGAGLPGNYLYVRLHDRYEGGIALDGVIST